MANGVQLFNGYRKLNDRLKILPREAHFLIGILLDEGCKTDDLQKRLEEQFLLHPLSISVLSWIQVDAHPTVRKDVDGQLRKDVRMLGNVSYSGSRLLWQVAPVQGFKFPFRGLIGKSSVKLIHYADSKDTAVFEKLVEPELERLREVLPPFMRSVGDWNSRIRAEIELQIRAY